MWGRAVSFISIVDRFRTERISAYVSSPITGLDRPSGFLGSQISWQRLGMVVGCQPYAPAAFTPRKYSCYSFMLEAESTPVDRKDFMSIKNPLAPAGIEPATFRFVAHRLNHCATAVLSAYVLAVSVFIAIKSDTHTHTGSYWTGHWDVIQISYKNARISGRLWDSNRSGSLLTVFWSKQWTFGIWQRRTF